MKRIVFGSIRENAGKTSLIIGMMKNLPKPFAYLKPFGDRLQYKKKHLWDMDSVLMKTLFNLDQDPEDMSLGFDHSKLRYMFTPETARERIREIARQVETNRDYIIFEGGRDLAYGHSAHLDVFSLCRAADAQLVIVVGGHSDQIMDDLAYFSQREIPGDIKLAGIVINKVTDIEDFKTVNGKDLESLKIPVLGILPWQSALSYPTVKLIADQLFAKVIAGEPGLSATVKQVFVGAMSGTAVSRLESFRKSDKLIITSGDRSDMIVAALDTKSAGIVLTNNILPPPNLIARAAEEQVPLLLVPNDTFQTAKKIDRLVPVPNTDDSSVITSLTENVKQHIDLSPFKSSSS